MIRAWTCKDVCGKRLFWIWLSVVEAFSCRAVPRAREQAGLDKEPGLAEEDHNEAHGNGKALRIFCFDNAALNGCAAGFLAVSNI